MGFMAFSPAMATRIVYTKAEADELTMFGFKITSETLLDDGRTKYVLTSVGAKSQTSPKASVDGETVWSDDGGSEEDLDWLED